MKVVIAREAQRELLEIWDWNVQHYGVAHANRYLDYIYGKIDELAQSYSAGRVVSSRPDLLFVQVRKRSRSNGHLLVYWLTAEAVTVVHVFHTSQDWQQRLKNEFS